MAARPLSHAIKHYTYEDYLKFDDDIRRELIDGVIYNMAAPNIAHQRVIGRLFNEIYNLLKGKPCEVFASPVDVRLAAHKFDDTVVQPDILVLCDKNKIDPKGQSIIGAPDMIIEVLSPSSVSMDKVKKHKKYLEAGVKEYWKVDPINKTVSVNLLENEKYYTWEYGDDNIVPSQTLPGLEINLAELWE